MAETMASITIRPMSQASAMPDATPTISVIVPVHNGAAMLRACLRGLAESEDRDFEVLVADDGSTDPEVGRILADAPVDFVSRGQRQGPAAARNRAAATARGRYLLFLDADVRVRSDVIARMKKAFADDPSIDAVFGSYDDAPAECGIVSQFKNLLHHYVHQHGREEASTFWSGCGAIKREVFREMGGFDESHGRPCIEDIELGGRLSRGGHRIRLDKGIQATHLKRWTLTGMIRCDVFDRGIPWTQLLLKNRQLPNDLNLKTSQRLSVGLAGMLVLAIITSLAGAPLVGALVAAASVFGIAALNRDLYGYFTQVRSFGFATAALPLHIVYFLCCGIGATLGSGAFFGKALVARAASSRFLSVAGADALAKLAGFVGLGAVVRAMGLDAFGQWQWGLALVAVVQTAAAFGLDRFAVREIARSPNRLGDLAPTFLAVRLATALTLYLGLVIVTRLAPPFHDLADIWPAIGLLLVADALTPVWALEGLRRTGLLAATTLARQFMFLGLVAIVLTASGAMGSVIAAQVVAEFALAGGLLFWLARAVPRLRPPMPPRQWFRLWRSSAAIGVARMLRSVSLGCDLLLLGMLSPMAEVGRYAAAYRLFLPAVAVAATYFIVVFPRWARRDAKLRRSVRQSLRETLIPALVLGAAVIACAETILRASFGEDGVGAVPLLRGLVLAGIVNFVGGHYRFELLARDRETTDLAITAASSVVHVAGKAALIAILGAAGAALGMILGEASLAFLGWRAVAGRRSPALISALPHDSHAPATEAAS